MVPKAKRKRGHVQLRTEVHPQQDAVVTRVEVTRSKNQRILTKSTKVSIPIVEDASSQHPPLQTPEPSALAAEDDDSGPAAKKARKGPSRSVAVSLVQLSFPQRVLTTNYRQASSSGCHMKTSSLTGS